MRYIKRFTKHEDYESYIASEEYICPNVSFCNNVEKEVHYNGCSPHDYSRDYLTFVATESGTFKFSGSSVNYSLDNGETWTTLASNTNSPTVNSGNTILWKASLTPSYSKGVGKFSSTGIFDVEGNPMSLLYGDDFRDKTDLTGKNYTFKNLFSGCAKLTSAENLSLPATTLANSCYCEMFYYCTSLTTAPKLPATTLATECYCRMFHGCTSLTTAPELPATTLAAGCYYFMFYNCTSLNSIKCLATDISASNCTSNWVNGVSSSGTFTKAASMTSWTRGYNGIPSFWTVVDA